MVCICLNKPACFLSVHHRVQHQKFLQRGGTYVLLQNEDPTIGWKQNVAPTTAPWLGLLPSSDWKYLHLTPPSELLYVTSRSGTNKKYFYFLSQLTICELKQVGFARQRTVISIYKYTTRCWREKWSNDAKAWTCTLNQCYFIVMPKVLIKHFSYHQFPWVSF